ncbi:MAG: efflux RND transporter periplasmic adaptor subunit [Bacteroidales bacterium]|nr:efflux RND transporter periplasmic adaptor subunit [Bacteroidales bacterium]
MRKILLLTLPFLLLVGCGNTDPQQLKERFIGGSTEERVIAVGIMNIDTTEGVIQNSYPGYLEEGQSVDLAFKYGGLLEQIYVKEGSRVTKGQRLAKASSPTLENSLRSAQATLEQAQDAYNRLKKVHDNGSLPDIKWKEMEANLEKAQAAYDLAYAMIAENDLTAPFSGTVSAVNVEVGENIPPLRPVVSLINTDKMSVKITVPENEIATIHTGDPAKIVIPALNDRHYSGQVTEKGMTASLLTHSYPVKVLVDNPDKDLASGMIAKVMLKADVNSAIIIPANAILINKDGKFVWVVENERATRRMIQISGYSGTGVIVSEGLKGGDQVIVEGYQKVSEGMKVSGK